MLTQRDLYTKGKNPVKGYKVILTLKRTIIQLFMLFPPSLERQIRCLVSSICADVLWPGPLFFYSVFSFYSFAFSSWKAIQTHSLAGLGFRAGSQLSACSLEWSHLSEKKFYLLLKEMLVIMYAAGTQSWCTLLKQFLSTSVIAWFYYYLQQAMSYANLFT